jgi:hypothetical protein
MIYWTWLIAAFLGGSISTAAIIALLNLGALRELEQERLMAEYPLPLPPEKKQGRNGGLRQCVTSSG